LPDRGALDDVEDVRRARYAAQWDAGGLAFLSLYRDLMVNKAANDTAAEFVREKILGAVDDKETASKLLPTTHPLGTKRICLEAGYFETFNRPNVTLVDIHTSPVVEILPDGLRTTEKDYKLDAIIFATGFDAITGSILKIDIRGRAGVSMRERWAEGPRANLGLMSAGFPNLFMITGPGSPAGLTNAIVSIEQNVEWINDCLGYMRGRGLDIVEADHDAEARWVDHVNEVASRTLYPLANSWFMGANIPGKPRVFMPYFESVARYGKICSEVAAKGYEGFIMTGARKRSKAAAL
jgi:cyclohexanone monooxygenase